MVLNWETGVNSELTPSPEPAVISKALYDANEQPLVVTEACSLRNPSVRRRSFDVLSREVSNPNLHSATLPSMSVPINNSSSKEARA